MSSISLPESNKKALLSQLPETSLSIALDKIIGKVNDYMIWI